MRKILRICLFAATAFVLLVYGRLALDIGQPYLGVILSNWTTEVYQVDAATPSVWKNTQYFPPGTCIIAVNGEPVNGSTNPVLKAWQAGQTQVMVSYILPYQPESNMRHEAFEIQVFSWLRYLELIFQFGIPTITCFLLALCLLNTRQMFNWQAIAGVIAAIFFILRQDDRGIPSSIIFANTAILPIDHPIQLMSRLVYGAYSLPVVFLLFTFPYPVQNIERWSRLLGLVAIAIALVAVIPYAAYLLGLQATIAKMWELNLLAGIRLFYAAIMLVFVLGSIKSLWKYTRQPNTNRLALLPIPILAVIGSFFWATVYFQTHQINWFSSEVSEAWSQILQTMNQIKFNFRPFYMVAGLMIVSIALRHQTFHELDSLFVFTATMITSVCIASMLDLLIRAISVTNEFWITPVIPLFFVILIAAEYTSLQIKKQSWMWRMFNWHIIAQQISQNLIARHQDLQQPTSTQQIVDMLTKEYALDRCAIWLWREIDQTFELLGAKTENAGDMKLLPAMIETELNNPAYLMKRAQLALPPNWQTKAWAHENGPVPTLDTSTMLGLFGSMSAFVPLNTSGRCLGLLTFGKRRDEAVFYALDLHLLDTAASNVALILLSHEQLEALKRLPFQIAQAQERERKHISNELHDSTQQFLGRLPIYMATLLESARQGDGSKAEQLLAQYEEEIRRESLLVRRLRSSLSPITLDHDFANSLRTLESRVAARSGLKVRVLCEPAVVNHTTALQREALYRIVQQAFDNVIQHAHASIVTASFRHNVVTRQIEFEINDDGLGIGADRPAQARVEGRYGLSIMQNRAQSNGGDCHIESDIGFGTRIYGWLPVVPS
ncbi:MAG: histidine kinase [Anaerolineae bacterium]|nr:histidine kinase [Anaerolineae bacterium]